jgi:hypothetical protein
MVHGDAVGDGDNGELARRAARRRHASLAWPACAASPIVHGVLTLTRLVGLPQQLASMPEPQCRVTRSRAAG